MPLAAIRQVLADRHVPERVDSLLAAHVARLEQGLADARRELSEVRSLLNTRECPMTTTLAFTGLNFRSALAAVRFAVSADPELRALGGVLLDISDGVVNLVATDRYRLAVAPVTASVDGPDQAVVVPLAFADGIAAAEATQIHLTLDVETVTAQAGALTLTSSVINELFPDYRRLMPTEDPEAVSIGSDLREAITNGPSLPHRREQDGVSYEATVLATNDDGDIVISDGVDGIAVNREFILEAIDAGDEGQLLLSLDGPIAPLVIRSTRSTSLLMPVRLHG